MIPGTSEDCEKDGTSCKCKAKVTDINPTKTPIVWVLGSPGSQKSLHCDKITAKYNFSYFRITSLLRAEVNSTSNRGKVIRSFVDRNEPVPNVIALAVLKEAMIAKADTSEGYLLNGFPWDRAQCYAFQNSIAAPSVILYFELPENTVLDRPLKGKIKSKFATKSRLKFTIDNNELIAAMFPTKLKRINVEKSEDDIFGNVTSILDPITKRAQAWRDHEKQQTIENSSSFGNFRL